MKVKKCHFSASKKDVWNLYYFCNAKKGIVTKALKILLSKVFQEFHGLVRLEAYTLLDNKASQRVLEKVGFQREGLLRIFFYLKGQERRSTILSTKTPETPTMAMNFKPYHNSEGAHGNGNTCFIKHDYLPGYHYKIQKPSINNIAASQPSEDSMESAQESQTSLATI
ncbi:unnamed protein product [Vicia faba]|uniref:N-acetyltransferase domain-containing protein n=1 Tax=Vicia faba TaxID=3906 RepID=A0AAV1AU48_VICFA|nr:unnamed protein product [Vicia faba]